MLVAKLRIPLALRMRMKFMLTYDATERKQSHENVTLSLAIFILRYWVRMFGTGIPIRWRGPTSSEAAEEELPEEAPLPTLLVEICIRIRDE